MLLIMISSHYVDGIARFINSKRVSWQYATGLTRPQLIHHHSRRPGKQKIRYTRRLKTRKGQEKVKMFVDQQGQIFPEVAPGV